MRRCRGAHDGRLPLLSSSPSDHSTTTSQYLALTLLASVAIVDFIPSTFHATATPTRRANDASRHSCRGAQETGADGDGLGRQGHRHRTACKSHMNGPPVENRRPGRADTRPGTDIRASAQPGQPAPDDAPRRRHLLRLRLLRRRMPIPQGLLLVLDDNIITRGAVDMDATFFDDCDETRLRHVGAGDSVGRD